MQHVKDTFPGLRKNRVTFTKTFYKNKRKHVELLEEEVLYALDTVREKLISPAVLFYLRQRVHYTLVTDAWDKQLGCVSLKD